VRVNTLRLLSFWAALTGLVLVALLGIQIGLGLPQSESLRMLIAAVVGFELFLFAQDLTARRRRRG
jgi:hypothetical protein